MKLAVEEKLQLPPTGAVHRYFASLHSEFPKKRPAR
jgi:hypothetical protein